MSDLNTIIADSGYNTYTKDKFIYFLMCVYFCNVSKENYLRLYNLLNSIVQEDIYVTNKHLIPWEPFEYTPLGEIAKYIEGDLESLLNLKDEQL